MMSPKRSVTFKQLLLSFFSWVPTLLIGSLATSYASAQTTPVRPPGITIVNAASMQEQTSVAPESLVTIFGQFKTQNNAAYSAPGLPFPETLGGVSVKIDTKNCLLSYVSPTQINLYVPASVKDLLPNYQTYLLTLTDSANQTFSRSVYIVNTTPGVFTAQSNGTGTAVGQVTNGVNTPTNIYHPDGTPKEIEVTTDGLQNYISIYGTGFRNALASIPNDANGVAEMYTATIQGIEAELTYVGPQGNYVGLDQINIKLPPQVAGLGLVTVRLSPVSYLWLGDGSYNNYTNPVTIKIGGASAPIVAKTIAPETSPFDATGELTRHSQVMKSASGKIYFYDAWRYQTTQKATTITLRSTFSSPLILIYKVAADKSLQFVSASNSNYEYNNSGNYFFLGGYSYYQLLLTTLPEAGEYLIFVTTGDNSPETIGQYQFTLNTSLTELKTANLPLSIQSKFDSTNLTTGSGRRLEGYWWAGKKGDKVEFEASAADFRPIIFVIKADGTVLDTTVNTIGTNSNPARLSVTLPEASDYLVVTTTPSAFALGPYSLMMRRPASQSENLARIETDRPNFSERQQNIDRLGARRIIDPEEN